MTIEQIAAAGDQIAFSSITLAEMVYLSEKGRIHEQTLDRLLAEVSGNTALFVEIPFDSTIAQTLRRVERSLIPELPDRMIAATAVHLNVPILSRDHRIRVSGLDSIW